MYELVPGTAPCPGGSAPPPPQRPPQHHHHAAHFTQEGEEEGEEGGEEEEGGGGERGCGVAAVGGAVAELLPEAAVAVGLAGRVARALRRAAAPGHRALCKVQGL